MKVLLLAAGYATRLYPLTLNTPKPLLPVADRLVLEYIFDLIEPLKEVDEVFIVTNEKFSVKPIQALFQRIGLELVVVERVATKGGSFVAHQFKKPFKIIIGEILDMNFPFATNNN